MVETPEVTILFLGDAEVGKSTFLSYVFLFSFTLFSTGHGYGHKLMIPSKSDLF